MPEVDAAIRVMQAPEAVAPSSDILAVPTEFAAAVESPDYVSAKQQEIAQELGTDTAVTDQHDSRAEALPEMSDLHIAVDSKKLTKAGLIKACPYFAEIAAKNPVLADSMAERTVQSYGQGVAMREAGLDEAAIKSQQWAAMRARRKEKKAAEKLEAEPETAPAVSAKQTTPAAKVSEVVAPAAASEPMVAVAREAARERELAPASETPTVKIAPVSEKSAVETPTALMAQPAIKPAVEVLAASQAEIATPGHEFPLAPELPVQAVRRPDLQGLRSHDAVSREPVPIVHPPAPVPELALPTAPDTLALLDAPVETAAPLRPNVLSEPAEAEAAVRHLHDAPAELAEFAAYQADPAADLLEGWRHDAQVKAGTVESTSLAVDYEPLPIEPLHAFEAVTEDGSLVDGEIAVHRQPDELAKLAAPEAAIDWEPDELSEPAQAEATDHHMTDILVESDGVAEFAASQAVAVADLSEGWRHDTQPQAATAEIAAGAVDYEPLLTEPLPTEPLPAEPLPAFEAVTEDALLADGEIEPRPHAVLEIATENAAEDAPPLDVSLGYDEFEPPLRALFEAVTDDAAEDTLPVYDGLELSLPGSENDDSEALVLPVVSDLGVMEDISAQTPKLPKKHTDAQLLELPVKAPDAQPIELPETPFIERVPSVEQVTWNPDLAKEPEEIYEDFVEVLQAAITPPVEKLSDTAEEPLEELPDKVENLLDTIDGQTYAGEGETTAAESQAIVAADPEDNSYTTTRASLAENSDVTADTNLTDTIETRPDPIPAVAITVTQRLREITAEEKETAVPLVKNIAEAIQTISLLEAEEATPAEAVEKVRTELKELVVDLFEELAIDYKPEEIERFIAVLLRPDLQAVQPYAAEPKEVDLEHNGTHEAKTHWPFAATSVLAAVEHDLRRILGSFALLSAQPSSGYRQTTARAYP
jgi:hypothetical protein